MLSWNDSITKASGICVRVSDFRLVQFACIFDLLQCFFSFSKHVVYDDNDKNDDDDDDGDE